MRVRTTRQTGRRMLATGSLVLASLTLGPVSTRAAPPTVIATCLSSQLYADTASSQGATQSTYYMLLFTNHGHSACPLSGIPSAQPVVGPRNSPVGPTAGRSRRARRGETVILTWRGAHRQANVYFSSDVVSELCRPRLTADGVVVSFSPALRFFLPTKYFQVCASRVTTSIDGVAPGTTGSI